MKKNSQISEKINSILSEILKISIDKTEDEIEMNKVPQWDSVAQLLIISSLEDEFKIQFSSSEISKLIDLKSITEIIENKNLKK
jgi:acyl carrier protein